jgi:inner membrane protein
LGALLIGGILTLFAQQRLRVFLLCLLVFHLHLLCDFVGSRGPSREDVWPLFYHGPFDKDPMWIWYGQWQLDSWINRIITLVLFAVSLALALRKGHSFVGVFSQRLDAVFVQTLRKWERQIRDRLA